MIFITGDLHGDFNRVASFCRKMKLTQEDICIILGEVGINFGGEARNESMRARFQEEVPCTVFCVHGNHEQRPSSREGYLQSEFFGGPVMVNPKYPRQIFALDGELYQIPINGVFRTGFVMGGAYSVDKYIRLAMHDKWFPDEQPSPEIKKHGLDTLQKCGWNVDIVLSHTCPLSVMPVEWFLRGFDQSKIDKSTEEYLEEIRKGLNFRHWYCGHYHGEKTDGKFTFLYRSFMELTV